MAAPASLCSTFLLSVLLQQEQRVALVRILLDFSVLHSASPLSCESMTRRPTNGPTLHYTFPSPDALAQWSGFSLLKLMASFMTASSALYKHRLDKVWASCVPACSWFP